MLSREIEPYLLKLWKSFPVITITGPRQSGKTTLAKKLWGGIPYVNLEDPAEREFASSDPRGFLARLKGHGVIDEIQYAPDLLSYIQMDVDENPGTGHYLLTGSNQFEYMKSVSQSLSGRTGILKLLPFSYKEVYARKKMNLEEVLFRGFYPPVHDRKMDPPDFYAAYLMTYLERDVRNITRTQNLTQFQKFMELCAGRSGQILNKAGMANELGISASTMEEWLSILEASFVIYRLRPFYKNFNKRVIKSPKLYFLDTGLLNYLLRIETPAQLIRHPLRGEIFETYVVGELIKRYYHSGRRDALYFYRDSNANEVDIILDTSRGPVPLEIKSGQTIHSDFFKGLDYFSRLQKSFKKSGLVIGRTIAEERSDYIIHGFNQVYDIHDKLTAEDNLL